MYYIFIIQFFILTIHVKSKKRIFTLIYVLWVLYMRNDLTLETYMESFIPFFE